MRKRGFSIIELMVVITIIALLAAILTPVFAQARKAAKAAHCTANIWQLGRGVHLYAADADDLLPYGPGPAEKGFVRRGSLFEANPFNDAIALLPSVDESLGPYIKSQDLWRCPEDQVPSLYRGPGESTWWKAVSSSYTYSYFDALSGRSLSSFEDSAKRVLFADISEFHAGGPDSGRGRMNVCFMDGHVQSLDFHKFSELVDDGLFWY